MKTRIAHTTPLIATLLLASTVAAFAGKGGKGKPGDGGEDPPPPPSDPAPVSYVLTWLGSDNDATRFFDIDADGVAVGSLHPGGNFDQRYPVASFPDRPGLVDLEVLAAPHIPAGWHLTTALFISDDLLICGDMWDDDGELYDEDGGMRSFAMKLADDGSEITLEWFSYFSSVDLGGETEWAFIYDASESGDILILTNAGTATEDTFVWNPENGSITGGYPVWNDINNAGQILGRQDLLIDTTTGAEFIIPTEIDADTTARPLALGEDGTLVGQLVTTSGRKNRTSTSSQAARFINGTWEAISPSVSGEGMKAWGINAGGDIFGVTGSDLFLYSDVADVGFRTMAELLDRTPGATNDANLAIWDAAGALLGAPGDYLPYGSISDPTPNGFGHICGTRIVDGMERGFILTPVIP